MYKVLIVEDDRAMKYIFKRFKVWGELGFKIHGEADDGKEALRRIEEDKYDFILTDIKMPGMDGIEFLKEMQEQNIHICVSLLSTHSDFEYAKQGILLGAFDYLVKPITEDILKETLIRVKKQLENQLLEKQHDHVVKQIMDENSKIYYTKEEEHAVLERLINNEGNSIDYASKLFDKINNSIEKDIIKLTNIIENLTHNIRNYILEEFPWLAFMTDLDICNYKVDSIVELKSVFLGYINIIEKTVEKYQLYNNDSIIKESCAYIFNNIEEDISLESVAEDIKVSKDYLSKVFKQKTCLNFSKYVTMVKMEHAKYLITNTRLKNYEIADRLNYSKPDYFGKLFKEYTGNTITQYRKKK